MKAEISLFLQQMNIKAHKETQAREKRIRERYVVQQSLFPLQFDQFLRSLTKLSMI
jgi:hypothetical protein